MRLLVFGLAARAVAALSVPPHRRAPSMRMSMAAPRQWIDKNFFVLGMVTAVASAAAAPQLGADGSFLRPQMISSYGVSMVFLLSGLSLRLGELRDAMLDVRLNALTQTVSLAAIPLACYPVIELARRAAWMPLSPHLLDGLLVTACLPTTVNMCVILTQSAGGNVAAALTNAVLGNILGIFATPALLMLTLKKEVALPFLAIVSKLAAKVVAPVLIGQLLRATPMRTVQARRKALFKRASEIILLLIMWNTFSTSFSKGLDTISFGEVAILGAALPLIHACSLAGLLYAFTSPLLRLAPRDAVASAYVASQKTLAFGIPLIKTIFADSPYLALYSAPIMILHPAQLIVGSTFVPFLQRYLAKKG